MRVRGDREDGTTEDVSLDEPDDGQEVLLIQQPGAIVAVCLHQEGEGHLRLELAHVPESVSDGLVVLAPAKRQAAVEACGAMDIGHHGGDVVTSRFFDPRVFLEGFVDIFELGDVTRAHGQVVAHKTIELSGVGFLAELHLHWAPMLAVELVLQ